MRVERYVGLAAAILLAVSGCGGDGKDADTTAVAVVAAEGEADSGPELSSSDIRWRVDKYRELDGDEENPERLIATVSGTPVDSMIVRFEIRTSKDGLLYRSEWPATSYMKYEDEGSAKDTARVLAETRVQVGRIFADSQFINGSATAGYSGKVDVDLDAIRYDLAEHQYRTTKGLARWSAISGQEAWAAINEIAKAIPVAKLNGIAAETRNKPAFRYYAGGEETYVVAWSPTEQRMVRIAACC